MFIKALDAEIVSLEEAMEYAELQDLAYCKEYSRWNRTVKFLKLVRKVYIKLMHLQEEKNRV